MSTSTTETCYKCGEPLNETAKSEHTGMCAECWRLRGEYTPTQKRRKAEGRQLSAEEAAEVRRRLGGPEPPLPDQQNR